MAKTKKQEKEIQPEGVVVEEEIVVEKQNKELSSESTEDQQEVQEQLDNPQELLQEHPMNWVDAYFKLLDLYVVMLTLHIDVKNKDPEFHEQTEQRYQLLFGVAHQLGERYIDISDWSLLEGALELKYEKAVEVLEAAQEILIKCLDLKKEDPRVRPMLEEFIWKVQFHIWSARSFTYKSNE